MNEKQTQWYFNCFVSFTLGWSGILLVEHGEGLSGELTIFLGLIFFSAAAESQSDKLKLLDDDFWVPSGISKLQIYFMVALVAWLFNVSRLLAFYHEYAWSIITWMLALLISTLVIKSLNGG